LPDQVKPFHQFYSRNMSYLMIKSLHGSSRDKFVMEIQGLIKLTYPPQD